jgi:hypothetical protein
MSGKIKIRGLVCATALIFLFAGISFGQKKGSQDPCGGHYVGEGLKAVFSESYTDIDPLHPGSTMTYYSNITNDIPGVYYEYWVPGGDCVFLFRNGHIVVSPNTSVNGRHVNMSFVGIPKIPSPTYCGKAYFLDGTPIQPTGIVFRSGGGYTGSRKPNGDLVLNAMGINPNLAGMLPGETLYCDFGAWTFTVEDDPSTPSYDESLDTYMFETRPVSVYYGMVDGKLRWVFRPIPEAFWIRVETKIKKTVTVTETPYENSMYRQIISNGRSSCNHGTFYFPFELILERL